MDKTYRELAEAIDALMIALGKQKDPVINEAIKTVTRARVKYKHALNLRILTQQKLNKTIGR